MFPGVGSLLVRVKENYHEVKHMDDFRVFTQIYVSVFPVQQRLLLELLVPHNSRDLPEYRSVPDLLVLGDAKLENRY